MMINASECLFPLPLFLFLGTARPEGDKGDFYSGRARPQKTEPLYTRLWRRSLHAYEHPVTMCEAFAHLNSSALFFFDVEL